MGNDEVEAEMEEEEEEEVAAVMAEAEEGVEIGEIGDQVDPGGEAD